MAAIASTRIIALQATDPRVTPIPIVLSADTVVTGIGTVGGINSTATTANNTANTANATANSANSTANTANNTANSALSAAQTAQAALLDKLNKSGGDVLSGAINVSTAGGFRAGTLTWDSSGNRTGGYGVALTSRGIMGHNGSAATFAIDSSGNATFSGALSAASGTFAGSLSAGGTVDITGYVKVTGASAVAEGTAAIIGRPANTSYTGVFGISGSGYGVRGKSISGYGVYGDSSSGRGVYGQSDYAPGVYGASTNSIGVHGISYSSVGVRAESGGGVALQCVGVMTKTGTERIPNLNADMLDGYHSDSFFRYMSYGYGAPAANAYITVYVGGITVRVPVAYP